MATSLRLAALAALVSAAAAAPCDIFAAAGTPCVCAHSVVRALYSTYNGPLYLLRRASDSHTAVVATTGPGGFANVATQAAFCAGTSCVIWRIFDQSPFANDLSIAPPGGYVPHIDNGVNASRWPVSVGGNRVFGAYFEGAMGYRIDATNSVATGNDAETLYMVTSGTHVNGGCCFDYGNAESDNHDDGAGTMEAVYFGTSTGWGKGLGNGPWVMMDAENGLFSGNTRENDNNTPLTSEYVTAMVKGGENGFALKGGDATQGVLKTMYDGVRPNGYQPMKKQGSIILGIGGDNSDSAVGTFYEGCVTQGYSTDAADDAVQADIVAAGYGK